MSKNNGRPGHDWDSIRQEYITTNISIRALAQKHKVRTRTLSDKSSKEGWVQKRKDYKEQVTTKTTTAVATKVAREKCNELAEILDLTNLARQKIYECLQQDCRPSDIRNLMESLETAERITRSITGAVNIKEQHKMDIDNQKLELEKRKAEADEVDKDIHVHIGGWEESWGK